ncbi:MAG: hypothetical protein JJU31_09885 [Wenzhouxiangella sp.]|nr:hypothetical protein [Wenzhouxiangella sp.]MCH8478196.1 hypothetical protein [Wenzhouxiangella sp.]
MIRTFGAILAAAMLAACASGNQAENEIADLVQADFSENLGISISDAEARCVAAALIDTLGEERALGTARDEGAILEAMTASEAGRIMQGIGDCNIAAFGG